MRGQFQQLFLATRATAMPEKLTVKDAKEMRGIEPRRHDEHDGVQKIGRKC
jgi:hypothetical protein